MVDVFSVAKRSQVMSRIRGCGNKSTEMVLVTAFRAKGIIGWRRHYPISGRPDFVFLRARLAVFVDGCFWHGCPKHSNSPVNNREFWALKLDANRRRDKRVNRMLRAAGWTVLRVWEHDLKASILSRTVHRIQTALQRRHRVDV